MHDIKSNIRMVEHLAAKSYGTGDATGATLDLAGFQNASFLVSAGTFGAGAKLNAKLQYSEDGLTFNDATTEQTGDVVAIDEMSAAGTAFLHLTKPTKRYYRVLATVGTAAVELAVFAAVGGARHLPVVQG